MKAVITGGAGFIGSHLLDRLIRDGWEHVVVVDNLFRGRLVNINAHLSNPAVTFAQADIRDEATLRSIIAGADVVFHLAAQSNVIGAVTDIDYSFSTNVVGTFNVLKVARDLGARRVVFTSSREVYGEAQYLPVDEGHPFNAKNSYGASKGAGEMYCRVFNNQGMGVSVVRLSNAYGPRDVDRVIPIWLTRALKGEDLIVYGGQQLIDFVWVDAIVEALTRVAAMDVMDPVNIGSGQGTAILDLAQRILSLTNSGSKIVVHPARSAEVAKFTADVRRMQERLGLQPPADALFGLPQLVEWYRSNPTPGLAGRACPGAQP